MIVLHALLRMVACFDCQLYLPFGPFDAQLRAEESQAAQ